MELKQFTFFASYWEAIRDLPADVRTAFYDAVIPYALSGEEQEISDPIARAMFCLVRPTIDNSRSKAAAGAAGGSVKSKTEAERKQNASKTEAEPKQNESRTEAEAKQTESETEANAKQNASYKEKGKGKNKDYLSLFGAPAPAQPQEEEIITLPLNDGQYVVYRTEADELQALYPSTDVVTELRKMKGWLDSHPQRRKTRRGIKAFLTTWLSSEQDKSTYRKPGGYSPPAKNNSGPAPMGDYERAAIAQMLAEAGIG